MSGCSAGIFRYRCASTVDIFAILLTAVAFSQSKGGRWTFENNGDDIAEWDATNNPGELQNMAIFDSSPPLQEGNAYLWLDTLQHIIFFLSTTVMI
ncbi:MAG: hypothetical protein R3C26_07580 [Calditrichia bacterium]